MCEQLKISTKPLLFELAQVGEEIAGNRGWGFAPTPYYQQTNI